LLCALSPFWALCGFRKIDETISLIEKAGIRDLNEEVGQLSRRSDSHGMKGFISHLMALDAMKRRKIVKQALDWAVSKNAFDPIAEWISRLCREFSEDVGALSPFYLNLLCLNPGDALYLPAGILHSYLQGTGIELMANSDNVIRGGLTTKHIDIKELIEVAEFDETDIQILKATPKNSLESNFLTPAREFALSIITLKEQDLFISESNRNIEILFCTRGNGRIEAENHPEIEINKGISVMIPAVVREYRIMGDLTLYKAYVPIYF
ncbi:MAG: mannose-6-phosphate isomerase, class I, partial [Thermodesulfobacteriota bacterium]